MKHHIDPTVDCVFKAVLGKEDNKNLLIHFLNAVLKPPRAERIQDVTITNPYNEREFQTDKLTVVDIKARDQQNRVYQVEIQLVAHDALAERMLYTWSALYHASLRKGQTFEHLTPVVAIWLLKEALFADIDAYHLPFVPYNIRHKRVLSPHQAIHVVQLPKWREPQKRLDEIDRWMYFFLKGKDLDPEHLPAPLQTEEMKQAMGVLYDFSQSQKDYLLYEQRLEAERLELMRARSQARQQAEIAQKQAEIAQKEAEITQKEAEITQKEAEITQKDAELARLAALLKQAGIDPDAAPTERST